MWLEPKGCQDKRMAAETLRGNCHCGRFRLELPGVSTKLSELEVAVCGCSLCTKLGCLWLRLSPDTLKVTRDEGTLVAYQGVQFCGNCGTVVVGGHTTGPLQNQHLLNARAIWGFNPFELGYVYLPLSITKLFLPELTLCHHANRHITHVPAPPEDTKTTDPTPNETGSPPAKHLGSCHCRKVRVELLVNLSDLQVKEDNCSSCIRARSSSAPFPTPPFGL